MIKGRFKHTALRLDGDYLLGDRFSPAQILAVHYVMLRGADVEVGGSPNGLAKSSVGRR